MFHYKGSMVDFTRKIIEGSMLVFQKVETFVDGDLLLFQHHAQYLQLYAERCALFQIQIWILWHEGEEVFPSLALFLLEVELYFEIVAR